MIEKVVFANDQMTLFWSDKKPRDFTFSIDPKKTPKAIDLTALRGVHKGKVNHGIYQLDGDGLKLCFPDVPGTKVRPVEFKAPAGSQLSLMTLERRKS
jgi:RNA polymerase sigma-70 factor (ECF subfamily)